MISVVNDVTARQVATPPAEGARRDDDVIAQRQQRQVYFRLQVVGDDETLPLHVLAAPLRVVADDEEDDAVAVLATKVLRRFPDVGQGRDPVPLPRPEAQHVPPSHVHPDPLRPALPRLHLRVLVQQRARAPLHLLLEGELAADGGSDVVEVAPRLEEPGERHVPLGQRLQPGVVGAEVSFPQRPEALAADVPGVGDGEGGGEDRGGGEGGDVRVVVEGHDAQQRRVLEHLVAQPGLRLQQDSGDGQRRRQSRCSGVGVGGGVVVFRRPSSGS